MASGDGVSWTRCSQILGDLTLEDRQALRAVWADVADVVSPSALVSLRRFGLIKHDGNRWVVTDDGRVVVLWC